MRAILIAVIALTGAARPAVADSVGDMPCLDVRQVMDDLDARKDEASRIERWVGVRFRVDDEAWIGAGHSAIASKWDAKGLLDSEGMVTASCGQHRADTLAKRTDAVFGEIARLEVMFGAAK